MIGRRGKGAKRAFPPIALAPAADTPLGRQIAGALRNAILGRQISIGTRLPSTRALAEELGVSRNTVLDAYSQLLSEGFLETRTGSGTFVSRQLSVLRDSVVERFGRRDSIRVSSRGSTIANAFASISDDLPRPFSPGLPWIDDRLVDTWWRVAGRTRRRISAEGLSYGETSGYGPLRRAIAAYVASSRGVRCSPFQVIVCAGAQLALASSARLLTDPADVAWVEDPGYSGARGALGAASVRLHPIAVDDDGLRVADAIQAAPAARLVYVSPSHQYPLGVTMSVERRRILLDWAARERAWILEDDYDAEFRFGSQPLPALQNLDRNGTVVYVGTFSKVLFPGLRLGYLVVPESLVDTFVRAHAVLGYRPPMPEQAILAEYIDGGHFTRHLRRMRSRYAEARGALVDAVARRLGDRLKIRGANVGLHVVGELTPGTDDTEVSRRAAFLNISAPPLSAYYTLRCPYPGLVLGFGHLDPRAIKAAVEQLALAITEDPRARARL